MFAKSVELRGGKGGRKINLGGKKKKGQVGRPLFPEPAPTNKSGRRTWGQTKGEKRTKERTGKKRGVKER